MRDAAGAQQVFVLGEELSCAVEASLLALEVLQQEGEIPIGFFNTLDHLRNSGDQVVLRDGRALFRDAQPGLHSAAAEIAQQGLVDAEHGGRAVLRAQCLRVR